MTEQLTSRIAGRIVDGKVLHVWDVERLWRLSRGLEVVEVSIDDLPEFDSDEPWYGYGVDTPTCRSVARHAKQIRDSDPTFPIILNFDNEVLDGMHRVAKAWMLGLKSVSAVRFDEPVDPDLVLEMKGDISPEEILKQLSSKRSEAQDEPCNTASNLSETAKTEN
ncbi:MAG: hypothetical protein F4X77_07815 [Acidobacteriia bacterium]|nr:hypothetical protein [Terriglobia bacterium]